ncbi:MAG: ABC transporter ATP-binding protein [Dehalococcoidales bacterium]|nr:ABC transporter ATP-binding protein [Dehalococcoidales bacterium]
MTTILRLLTFGKKYWAIWLLAFICLLLSTGFSLIIPMQLAAGIDSALKAESRNVIIIAAVIIVSASVLNGIVGYFNRYLTQVVSQKVSYDIRNAIYDHLQRLSFAYHDKQQTGQLMSRATVDIEAVRLFLSEGLLNVFSTILLLAGITVLLFITSWSLAFMTLAFMPFIVWITFLLARKMQPIWMTVQQLIAALGVTLQENLAGIRVVKAFSQQGNEQEKFTKDAEKLYHAQIGTARIMAINMPMMGFIMSIPIALVIWYGGQQVIAGNMTVGGIVQFIVYLGLLSMPVRRLGMITAMLSRFLSAGKRVIEVFDTQSLVKDKPGAITLRRTRGAVRFEYVGFAYDSSSATLEDINFNVEPGQLVALVGGSGSGKSTIIHLIPRFYDVTSGRISVDGIDIRDISLDSLRKNVGIAQQDVFLFSATVKENIAFGIPDANMEQITMATRAAQIDDFIMGLPDKYDTWVGERGVTFSGGEKQRIVIARTLLLDPGILILDDSTSSVDAETEHLIRRALEVLIKGRTTFIITHRLPIIRNADLILVLKDGRIVERGQHRDLMELNGLYKQTYLSQLSAPDGKTE